MESQLVKYMGIFSSVLAFVLLVSWIYGYKQLNGLSSTAPAYFNWHPILMYVGYGVCMGHGIVAFRAFEFERSHRKLVHAVLNSIGFVFALAGFIVVIRFHDMIKAPHFYSAHAWAGVAVFSLSCLQVLWGIGAYGLGLASQNLKAAAMPYHRSLGKAIYLGAVACFVSGLMQKQSFIRAASQTWDGVNVFGNVVVLAFLFNAAVLLRGGEEPKRGDGDGSLPLRG
eukprot:GDKH01014031.1.p1 GENE.GDKH01014031.1~~GDKH01014031.1.p1  ORF type:complete len:226 (-),score=46.59 GDKH01014031.1:266-943(-)